MSPRRSTSVALAAGALFSLGLMLAGMGDPATVLRGFTLDETFDPRLHAMFLGALVVHAAVRAWLRRKRPASEPRTALPPTIDARLVFGSIVFGVGWGLGGICPGPAFFVALTGAPHATVFFAGLTSGLFAYHLGIEKLTQGDRSWL